MKLIWRSQLFNKTLRTWLQLPIYRNNILISIYIAHKITQSQHCEIGSVTVAKNSRHFVTLTNPIMSLSWKLCQQCNLDSGISTSFSHQGEVTHDSTSLSHIMSATKFSDAHYIVNKQRCLAERHGIKGVHFLLSFFNLLLLHQFQQSPSLSCMGLLFNQTRIPSSAIFSILLSSSCLCRFRSDAIEAT